MNCEKCKNKKATLFYSDENGGRHALCTVCGAKRDKSIPIGESNLSDKEPERFIPPQTLTSIYEESSSLTLTSYSDSVCRGCASHLAEVSEKGEMFCPECYSSFKDNVFPPQILSKESPQIKMPYLLAENANKRKLLAELKLQLKNAVERENFELAATLRDKIKMIENK